MKQLTEKLIMNLTKSGKVGVRVYEVCFAKGAWHLVAIRRVLHAFSVAPVLVGWHASCSHGVKPNCLRLCQSLIKVARPNKPANSVVLNKADTKDLPSGCQTNVHMIRPQIGAILRLAQRKLTSQPA